MSKFITAFALLFSLSTSYTTATSVSDDFVVYDFPRGGIYTLDSALNLLTGRCLQFFPNNPVKSEAHCAARMASLKANNQYESEHWFWKYELALWRHNLGCKILFLQRDPRDVLIGFLHFIHKGNKIGDISIHTWFGGLTQEEQIATLIQYLHDNGISKQIRDRLGWLYMPNTLVVKYENLIGPQGGGTHVAQVQELQRISNHIHLQVSNQELNQIASLIYDHTPERLQMGEVGMWKNYFTDHHKLLFKQALGDVLIQLGYEKDLYW